MFWAIGRIPIEARGFERKALLKKDDISSLNSRGGGGFLSAEERSLLRHLCGLLASVLTYSYVMPICPGRPMEERCFFFMMIGIMSTENRPINQNVLK